jgi:anhydro-N-acetylmuramic acid kinase
MAFVTLQPAGDRWVYQLMESETLPYPEAWQVRLAHVENQSALAYSLLDCELGTYMGQAARTFVTRHGLQPDFIASHGHTIFHQPEKKLTTQIGHGAYLAAASGLPVVCDFRTTDVAMGGQGAPLVPIGDALLFGEYACCLNLGGIANISARVKGQRHAFDCCPANMALNGLARMAGLPFDQDGIIASSGTFIPGLFQALNQLPFYQQPWPKSLGKEWYLAEFLPLIKQYDANLEELMYTVVRHIAFQIGRAVAGLGIEGGSLLVTGGGAYHRVLIDEIRREIPDLDVVVPEPGLVEYKEALVFALLGALRFAGQPNCLPSVTGALAPTCGGAVFLPPFL